MVENREESVTFIGSDEDDSSQWTVEGHGGANAGGGSGDGSPAPPAVTVRGSVAVASATAASSNAAQRLVTHDPEERAEQVAPVEVEFEIELATPGDLTDAAVPVVILVPAIASEHGATVNARAPVAFPGSSSGGGRIDDSGSPTDLQVHGDGSRPSGLEGGGGNVVEGAQVGAGGTVVPPSPESTATATNDPALTTPTTPTTQSAASPGAGLNLGETYQFQMPEPIEGGGGAGETVGAGNGSPASASKSLGRGRLDDNGIPIELRVYGDERSPSGREVGAVNDVDKAQVGDGGAGVKIDGVEEEVGKEASVKKKDCGVQTDGVDGDVLSGRQIHNPGQARPWLNRFVRVFKWLIILVIVVVVFFVIVDIDLRLATPDFDLYDRMRTHPEKFEEARRVMRERAARVIRERTANLPE